MAVPMLAKGIVVYLCIGLLLTLMGGPEAEGLPNAMSGFFINETTGELQSSFTDNLPNVNEKNTGGTGDDFFRIIDTLKAVSAFVAFIGTVVLAVPMVLLDAQLPDIVRIIFGVPTLVMLFLGLIYFARSGT